MTDHMQRVKEMYAAFGRGDVDFILGCLAPDIGWEHWDVDHSAQAARVPWLQPRTSREGVREFFSIIGTFQFLDFRVLSLMAGGNQVAAEIATEWKWPATGAHVKEEEMHLWTFNDAGQVTRFRHYVDTAKHIAASRKTAR